jgi:hypothetical protein
VKFAMGHSKLALDETHTYNPLTGNVADIDITHHARFSGPVVESLRNPGRACLGMPG